MAEPIFENIEQTIIVTIDDVYLFQSESKQYTQRRLPWKINVYKVSNIDGGDSLNIDLELLPSNDSDANQNFSCVAIVVAELQSFGERKPPHVAQIDPSEFSRMNPKRSMKLIEWQMLIDPENRFINGSQIKIGILIKTDERKLFDENNKLLPLDNAHEDVRKFQLTFHKVGNVLASISPELDGFPLRMKLLKMESRDEEIDDYLNIYLWNWRKNNGGEVVKIQAKVMLLSTDPECPAIERNTGIITIGAEEFGFPYFILWPRLQAKYMGANGSVSIEVEIQEVKPEPEPEPEPEMKQRLSPPPSTSTFHTSYQGGTKCSFCGEKNTLFRMSCGHLYCDACINDRADCCVCGELNIPEIGGQIVLFH